MTTVAMVFGLLLAISVITIGVLITVNTGLKRIISTHISEKRELRTELERSQLIRDAVIKHRDELIILNNDLKIRHDLDGATISAYHTRNVKYQKQIEVLTESHNALKADFGALLTEIAVDMCKVEVAKCKSKTDKVAKVDKVKGKVARKGKDKPPSAPKVSTDS